MHWTLCATALTRFDNVHCPVILSQINCYLSSALRMFLLDTFTVPKDSAERLSKTCGINYEQVLD